MDLQAHRGGDTEPIGPILSRLLTQSGVNQFLAHQKLHANWQQVVDPRLARHTRLAGLRGNVLRVEVDSAAHLQELASFYKRSILERLRAAGGAFLIRDIEFRIGSF
jgi:predicted nucleic acid-binding Zn ribbon protein